MKSSISDLAYFGGSPTFESLKYVGTPNIGSRQNFERRMADILDRRWLTNQGKYLVEFEAELAKYLGVKHCIAVCNATIGLELAIRALDLKGEVIVPSFTFIASAHSLYWQRTQPIFCEIDATTHSIDVERIEQHITSETTGILAVHLWGEPCHIEALTDIAKRHNLKLLFDSAHAFGCTYGGTKIGNFGDAEVFSFHATKILNSFEGGAIATNNDELAKKIRLMLNFGFTGIDRVASVGTNGKMSEVSAAMGLTNLESFSDFQARYLENYRAYQRGLEGCEILELYEYSEDEDRNYQYIVTTVNTRNSFLSRDHIVQLLCAENIFARRYFYPGCHKMEPYRSTYPSKGLSLPVTESIASKTICLPTGTSFDPVNIAKVCEVIEFIANNQRELAQHFPEPVVEIRHLDPHLRPNFAR